MSEASAGRGRHFGCGRIGAVCAVVLAWAMLVPATSGAVTGGAIAGTVRAAVGGAPLEGIEVCAFPTSSPGFGGCDVSGADGGYAIAGVDPGGYRVSFEGFGSTYIDQYYDHASSWFDADSVSVSEGATTSGIDADLEEAGSISGTVTAADGGEPIEGITVCAEGSFNSHCSDTGADGTYTIQSLGEGDYEVSFRGFYVENGSGEFEPLNYIRQYYDGKSSEADADPVAVVAGEDTPGIDAAMEEGAELAGNVTAAADGEPVEGAEVCLYAAASGNQGRCTSTDQDGDYLLFGIPGGNYKVGFEVETFNTPYAPQYYDAAPTLASADVVALSVGARTGDVDAVLHEAGKIAGTVTAAATGEGAENVQVCAQPVKSGASKCVSTDADGEYTIVGVRAGEHTVSFGGAPAYLSQYYSGAANFNEADRILVEDEATTSGIDAALQPAGRIEGKATLAATGKALSGAEVCAVKSTAVSYFPTVCVQSGLDGTYEIGGLHSAKYDVRFSAGFGETGPGEFGKLDYLTQFYKGKPSRGEADPVAVTAGKATTGIDAAMQSGGNVSGTVVDAVSGDGVKAYVCVVPAIRHAGDEGCSFANGDGKYTVRGLRSASYKVRFSSGPSDLSYLRQWYDGKATKAEADPIAVVAGQTTAGIDAELKRGGTIAGTVTDADGGAPLAGIMVCVGSFGACDTTASDGSYELIGLPTGGFKVSFGNPPATLPRYAPTFYHDAATRAEADPVAVTAGATTANVNQALHEGASVSGIVTDAVGKGPLAEISVCATDPATGYGSCDQTDEDGEYTIPGLPAGSYRVRFSHDNVWPPGTNGKYAPLYFDGALTPAGATLLDLDVGESADGVDAEVLAGGGVAGTVTLASNHAPMPGVGVCAVPENREEEWREECSFSEGDGGYEIEGLSDGTYVVGFYAGYQAPFEVPNLQHQYYNGAQRWEDATLVSVSAGSIVSGIDAELAAGGQIAGRVTAAASGAPLEGIEVCAYEADGGEDDISACESSNAHGEYTISRLATGSYKVRFSALFFESEEEPFGEEEEEGEVADPQEEFATQFYPGKGSLGTATAVAATAGGMTTGIDAQMVKPGSGGGEEPEGGGSSPPPPAAPAPVVTPPPVTKPKPLRCRKGFRGKVVKGKRRCVRTHRAKHHRRRHY